MVNSQRHLIADRHALTAAYCSRITEMNSSAFADSGSSRLVTIPYSRSVLGRLIGRRTRSARATLSDRIVLGRTPTMPASRTRWRAAKIEVVSTHVSGELAPTAVKAASSTGPAGLVQGCTTQGR